MKLCFCSRYVRITNQIISYYTFSIFSFGSMMFNVYLAPRLFIWKSSSWLDCEKWEAPSLQVSHDALSRRRAFHEGTDETTGRTNWRFLVTDRPFWRKIRRKIAKSGPVEMKEAMQIVKLWQLQVSSGFPYVSFMATSHGSLWDCHSHQTVVVWIVDQSSSASYFQRLIISCYAHVCALCCCRNPDLYPCVSTYIHL